LVWNLIRSSFTWTLSASVERGARVVEVLVPGFANAIVAIAATEAATVIMMTTARVRVSFIAPPFLTALPVEAGTLE
jgi:hypothetical protein